MPTVVLGADQTGDGKQDLNITGNLAQGTINGAIYADADSLGSGTGSYNTFLAIQDNNDPNAYEQGFNSDDSGSLDPTNTEMDAAKSHTVKLGDLVVTSVNGVLYYEFRVDLNESNSDPTIAQISLDTFKIYTSTDATIESSTTLFTQNLAYDMDAGNDVSVLMTDGQSSGSGTDDYSVLVPVSNFAGLDPATTYVYLFIQMGAADGSPPDTWGVNATFEEWNIENGVTLTGVKFNDANGNGVRDNGEAGVGGVTIFIDSNHNGTLDAGERSTVTAADGSYSFYGVKLGDTYWIDEVIPAGQQQSTGDHEEITIASNAKAGTTFVVDPIGNFTPNPALNVTKVVSSITGGVGGKANSAGDVINYTIDVQNTGNIALHNITVTDPNATTLTAVLSGGFNTGDLDHDNVLDVGETWHYTATHTVTQAELDGKGIDIAGAIDGDGDDDNRVTADSTETPPDTADASAPLDYSPALNVTKAVSSITGGQGTNGLNGADSAGDVIHYDISVQNTGNITLTNITVTDVNADAGSITYQSGDTDSDGKLDVGETWLYTATHTVTQAELDGQGIDNTGAVDGDGDVDNTVHADSAETPEDTADANAPLIYAPSFNIVKDVDFVDNVENDGKVHHAGDVIHYAISVDNTGNISLTGVSVTDPYADAGSIQYVSGDTDLDGKLDVNETWHYVATHTVTQPEIDSNGGGNGSLENTATAHSNETPDDSDDAEVPLAFAPNINIIKDVSSITGGQGTDGLDGADDAGDVINYSITVQNTGNVSLTNVVVTDPNADPGSIQAVDVDSDGFNDGDTNKDGILQTTEEWHYTAQHTVTQDELDTKGGGDFDIDNTATADSTETGPDTDTAEAPLIYAPGLNVTKEVTSIDGGQGTDGLDGADSDGDVINYEIHVINTGNITLTNITVTDPNADAGSITYQSGDSDSDGKLDVGETWIYTATHTVTQDELDHQGIDNTGAFDGDGDDDNTVTADSNETPEDTADASAPLVYNPHITIDKTASVDGDCADTVGELVNYSISVTNDGNITLENVVVTDPVADAGSIEGVDADSDGFNDGDTNANGKLDVGETWAYTAYHTVTQADIDAGGNYDSDLDGHNDSIRNVATVNADVVASDNTVTDDDDATVEVCQNPHITIEKSASVDGDCADTVGELVNYTLDVTNDGNVSLTSLLLSDTVADAGSITAVDLDSDGFNDGDTNQDGVLSVGETWQYTAFHTVTQADIDAGGNYDSDSDGTNDSIRNVATADATVVGTDDHVTDDDDAVVEVCQNPHITVDKTATPTGDCADTAGELVNYSISVTNDGNVTLDTVVVTDPMADAGSIQAVDLDSDGINDGDTNGDGKLDVGETWQYTAYHTVTQAEIDAGGNYDSSAPPDGINDSLRNVATATAEVVGTDTQVTDDDDAVVEVCQNPSVDITKYVDVGFGWDDANTGPGPQNVNVGADVDFKLTIENTGNVTLTDVDITDTNLTNGSPGTPHLLVDNGALTQFALDHGASLSGDTDSDGDLDVGETWTILYNQPFDPGEHLNTADVTDAQGATDEDSAYYFSLVNLGPCPRTPGFWQNMKNGGLFWDGITGNEKHAGEHDFPDGELLYAVDSNHDGVINSSDKAGLLIGDWNKNGLTDAGEDTLFVNYADARSLINASNKQLNSLSGDGKFMLGRDMVAAWLNYEMGAGFGDASDPASPTSYLQDAINYMQIYGGKTAGGLNETFDEFVLAGPIKTSSPLWKQVQNGVLHSGSQLHGALDYYNNTGQTSPGGTLYANCGDAFDQALAIYESAHQSATIGMASLTTTKVAPTMTTTTMSTSTVSQMSIATTDFGDSFHLGSNALHTYDLI